MANSDERGVGINSPAGGRRRRRDARSGSRAEVAEHVQGAVHGVVVVVERLAVRVRSNRGSVLQVRPRSKLRGMCTRRTRGRGDAPVRRRVAARSRTRYGSAKPSAGVPVPTTCRLGRGTARGRQAVAGSTDWNADAGQMIAAGDNRYQRAVRGGERGLRVASGDHFRVVRIADGHRVPTECPIVRGGSARMPRFG